MRRPPILPALSLALLLAACSGEETAGGPGGPGGEMPPMAVEAVTVKSAPLQAGVTTVGSLRADEAVVVRPEVSGRIVRIHFEDGQRVKAGEPIISLDDSVARADLLEAEANLLNARRANERATDLGSRQLLSRSDVDSARAQLGVSEARVASARAQLDKTTIRAPFSGVLGLREVSLGEVVSPGQALVNLVSLDPMEVDFSLPESALPQVAPGQAVRVEVDAFPGETFAGEVTAIDPVIDVNSRSARVRARVANPEYRLRPGLFARVRLGTGDAGATAILVPEQALLQEGDTRYVYVVREGKAVKAPVTTGQRLPGQVAVLDGLADGDVVITAGQAKPMFFEGAPVMVLPAEGEAPAQAGGTPAEGADGTANAG